MLRITVGLASVLWLGCRTVGTSSNVKIDGGHLVLDSGSYMPGVLEIVYRRNGCTATAVSDTTLITAAHCIWTAENKSLGDSVSQIEGNSKVCAKLPDSKEVCTDRAYFPSTYQDKHFESDIAIIVFDQKVFKYWHALGPNTPLNSGSDALAVGFSKQMLYSADFPKRWGPLVVVENKSEKGTKSEIWSERALEDLSKVGLSPGDSGGPLLDTNCRIRGVASRILADQPEPSRPKVSIHTSLVFKSNVEFLTAVASKYRAKYCEIGEACEALPGFVRKVNVEKAKLFPCKAQAEDSDPELKTAIEELQKQREKAKDAPATLVHCDNEYDLRNQHSKKIICVELGIFEARDKKTVCGAEVIFPTGHKLLTIDEAHKAKQTRLSERLRVGPDFALNGSTPSSGVFSELVCSDRTGTDSNRCCIQGVCRKVHTTTDGLYPTLGQEVPCEDAKEIHDLVRKSIVRNYPSFKSVSIGPSVQELEAQPFYCEDLLALAMRKTVGICYEELILSDPGPYGPIFVPDPSKCLRVKSGVKTTEKIQCPEMKLQDGV